MALPSLLLALVMACLSYSEIGLSRNWPLFFTIEWRWPGWASVALAVVLLTASAMAINSVVNGFELNGRRNSFAGAYFILLASMADFTEAQAWHLSFILLFVLMLYFCFSIFRKLRKNALLVNIGFVTGILVLLDLNWLPIILFAFIAVNSLNFLKFNELLLFLLSIALPLFYEYLYLSIAQSPPESFQWIGSFKYAWLWPQSYYQWLSWALFVGLALIQLGGMPRLISSLRIGPKKFLWVVQYLLGFILLVVLLYPELRTQVFVYGGLPIAIIISSRVSHTKNKQADLFWFYLLLSLFVLLSILRAIPAA